ncbi:MAG TPA: hypothetical protein ENK18_19920 [Deltaproteobacteria bacterium]|nr:hypothetical protein [Deltaproteobacteria bacterium]
MPRLSHAVFAAWLLGPSITHACPDYSTDPSLLVALEPGATKGALSDDEKACLEQRYASAEQQTTKDKISRVLLVNAYAYSTSYWAELVQRHLDEVDRSDPDIAYLYAFYLFNTDKEAAPEVVRWTEVALERRDVWTGEVFVGRVFGLMRLRAVAAQAQWIQAEEVVAREGTDESRAEAGRLKNQVKTYSREWVDFARVAGREPGEAIRLCLSVASNAMACGIDEDDLPR